MPMGGFLSSIKGSVERDPIILSHHPFCERFRGHTVRIRGYHVCMGCLCGFPSGFAAFFAALAAVPALDVQARTIFILALAILGISASRVLFRSGPALGMVFRCLTGASFGLLVASIVLAPSRGDMILFGAVGLTLFSVFLGLKGLLSLRPCRTCPEYPQFPHCSGAYPDDGAAGSRGGKWKNRPPESRDGRPRGPARRAHDRNSSFPTTKNTRARTPKTSE